MKTMLKIHRWVSLICAVFLLLLTVTGIGLLFRREINAANTMNMMTTDGAMSIGEIWEGLTDGLERVGAAYSGKQIVAATPDAGSGTINFRLGSGNKSEAAQLRMGGEQVMYDVRTGDMMSRKERKYRSKLVKDIMFKIHILHVQLGLGVAGRYFLTFMCFLSIIAIISGFFIYAPMMKGVRFGIMRRQSTRLYYSDMHKVFSVAAATFAGLLSVSALMIVAYSVGVADYREAAPVMAAEHYEAARADGGDEARIISAADALARAGAEHPDMVAISVLMPSAGDDFYIVQMTEPPKKMTNFMLGEMVFVPKDASTSAAPYLAPMPAWIKLASSALNLHIHSHDLFIQKIIWAVYLIFTVIMIVSGLMVHSTRWKNTVNKSAGRFVPDFKAPIWKVPITFAVLIIIGMTAPIWGGIGNIIGLIALTLPLVYLVGAIAMGVRMRKL